MLAIILRILAIIGIFVLVILGIVLLLLVLILFVPISYRVTVHKNESLSAKVKAGWLFGFVRFRFFYPLPGKPVLKVLFFDLLRGKKEPDEKEPKERPPKKRKKDRHPDAETAGSKASQTRQKESAAEKPQAAKSEKITGSVNALEGGETLKEEDVSDQPRVGFVQKIRDFADKIRKIKENISYYKEIFLADESKQVYGYVLKKCWRFLKHISPRKLSGTVRFGAKTPDVTGYATAVYSVLRPLFGKHFTFEPDFENEVLEADADIRGRLTVFEAVHLFLTVYFDKKVRKFYRQF